ncbi:MAG: hypothetical protein PHY16_14285 [Methylobacter sp.]|nr:hypothetical protein [Methylobacter sp.]
MSYASYHFDALLTDKYRLTPVFVREEKARLRQLFRFEKNPARLSSEFNL